MRHPVCHSHSGRGELLTPTSSLAGWSRPSNSTCRGVRLRDFCGQVSLTIVIDIFSTRVLNNVASCLQIVKRKSHFLPHDRACFAHARVPSRASFTRCALLVMWSTSELCTHVVARCATTAQHCIARRSPGNIVRAARPIFVPPRVREEFISFNNLRSDFTFSAANFLARVSTHHAAQSNADDDERAIADSCAKKRAPLFARSAIEARCSFAIHSARVRITRENIFGKIFRAARLLRADCHLVSATTRHLRALTARLQRQTTSL